MKYVTLHASSLIDANTAKNIRACSEFISKKLNLKIVKTESMARLEEEIIDLLKPIFPDIAIVQRDLDYDILNLALQNILQQASIAINNSKATKSGE